MTIRRIIPNVITSCNLLSGVAGLFSAFAGRPVQALVCMLAAGLFDFLDGFAARLLKSDSKIGAELDSLSDAVSFGVLPAVMLTLGMREGLGTAALWQKALCLLPLLVAVFSAVRLAKFNVDTRQHETFLGLPTPAAAIFCASLSILCGQWWLILAAAAAICVLLVCEIPFFSFKKGSGSSFAGNIKITCFASISAIAVILAVVLSWHWTAIPLGITLVYIAENLILAAFRI